MPSGRQIWIAIASRISAAPRRRAQRAARQRYAADDPERARLPRGKRVHRPARGHRRARLIAAPACIAAPASARLAPHDVTMPAAHTFESYLIAATMTDLRVKAHVYHANFRHHGLCSRREIAHRGNKTHRELRSARRAQLIDSSRQIQCASRWAARSHVEISSSTFFKNRHKGICSSGFRTEFSQRRWTPRSRAGRGGNAANRCAAPLRITNEVFSGRSTRSSAGAGDPVGRRARGARGLPCSGCNSPSRARRSTSPQRTHAFSRTFARGTASWSYAAQRLARFADMESPTWRPARHANSTRVPHVGELPRRCRRARCRAVDVLDGVLARQALVRHQRIADR